MGLFAVKHFLKVISFFHEMLVDSIEFFDFGHAMELAVDIGPWAVGDPVGGVGEYLDLSSRSGKQVPPLRRIEFILSKFNLGSQHERKQQFMFLKQRSANILIQRVCKIIIKILQPLFQFFGGQGILNRHLEQIDEPLKRVLVHRVDSRQVNDTEKQ